MQHHDKDFFLGLAVWAYSGFYGRLYPNSASRAHALSLYCNRFLAVENNSSFYAFPSTETLRKWHESTPSQFQFVLKVPQEISHQGLLADNISRADAFISFTRKILGDKCGPFMLQLPPRYTPQFGPDLSIFLNAWNRKNLGPISVEFRHPGWFSDSFYDRSSTLLRRLGMSRTILDTRAIYDQDDDPQAKIQNKKPKLPVNMTPTNDTILVRYISHPEQSRNEKYWIEWSKQIGVWLDEGKRVYFFMHCPQESFSPENARAFHRCLKSYRPSIPELPWNNLPPDPQLSLF